MRHVQEFKGCPYHFYNTMGASWAINGKWRVEGPGMEPLHFNDRTTAATVSRALNIAYMAGKVSNNGNRKSKSKRS